MKIYFSTAVVSRFLALSVFALALLVQSAGAVILLGSGDPTYNTTAPTGTLANSGWQYEGAWGSFLGTPIAPQYFIAARHVGGAVGQTFTFQGVAYTTTAYWDDPYTDFRIWKVSGVFPTYAPLYSLYDEAGKTMVVIGRGTQRGSAVNTGYTLQTNTTTSTVSLKALGITQKTAQKSFPGATFKGDLMTFKSTTITTNYISKGWKAGADDGVMRWGQSQVASVSKYIVGKFDKNGGTNQAHLSSGDSSGAVFVQDSGVWKLAGINYAVDGPFGLTATDSFYGAIYEESGLYMGGSLVPDDGVVKPAGFFATRITNRIAWIQSIVSQ